MMFASCFRFHKPIHTGNDIDYSPSRMGQRLYADSARAVYRRYKGFELTV